MPTYDEITLARLIGSLPPAPSAWVDAASALPETRRDLERILPMIELDAELREAMNQDLESALERAGVEPRPQLVAELRRQLTADSDDR